LLPGFETATGTDELLVEIQAGSGVLSNDYPGGEGNYESYGYYRYGFNGKENDNEVKGAGNQQDYGMRIYDPRLGRFLSVDPLTSGQPFYSPYNYAGNKPIVSIDRNGEVEIIVNHVIYAQNGKTILRQYTNKYSIETVEDLRGIHRDPIEVEIIERMAPTSYQWGGTHVTWEIPNVLSIIVKGGSSHEDRMFAGAGGQALKWYYKALKKYWPPAKLNDAFVNGDRDPVNNEYRDPSVKYFQSAEAVIDAVGIGRAPFLKDGLKELAESQLKRIIDWGAEEAMKMASKELGLDSEKRMVLGYYLTKYGYEGGTGRFNKMFKLIEAMVKAGTKGAEAIEEFKRNGLDLNLPKGKDEAVGIVLKSEVPGG
jgi:RHS repeat-associated protein